MAEKTMLCRAILRAGNSVCRCLANETSPLPYMQAMILSELHGRPGNTATSRELAQCFQVSASAVSAIVKRMRRAGLVSIQPNARDKRLLDVRLAEEAFSQAEQVKDQLADAERQIRGNLSEDEIDALFELLKKIGRNASEITAANENEDRKERTQ